MVQPSDAFKYLGMDVDEAGGTVACRYGLSGRNFTEHISLGPGLAWGPEAHEAARLVYLLAGVSYYKAAAPPVVDLGDTPVRAAEVDFVRTFYVEGLGEFAYRNGLDLAALRVEGGQPIPGGTPAPTPAAAPAAVPTSTLALAGGPLPARPLIPFGGGIDSIVTVESIRHLVDDAALFVLSRPGDRFAAIEAAAAVSALPIVRAGRELDSQILRSTSLGLRNGHVPITGILSAVAVLAAALYRCDAVVMSNEWSASVGNVRVGDRWVNHQWSKSLEFEERFAAVVDVALGASVRYFSALRPYTELHIAERFAALERYHPVFRSCNRAFAVDPARRLSEWCGVCDKCCFIDLVLAPFLPVERLHTIFSGREPLDDPRLAERFRTLVALSPDTKPWECVGDTDESRAALVLAAARPDRAATPLLHTLVAELGAGAGAARALVPALLRPVGPHHVPDGVDLLASPPRLEPVTPKRSNGRRVAR